MNLSRRDMIGATLGGTVALTVLPAMPVLAKADPVQQAINDFTGGTSPAEGKIDLRTPEIAENGNTVPVEFEVESEMTEASYVSDVLVLADGNPSPGVATFHFTPMSGLASASTRIRLAKTQNVIVVAKMNSGETYMAKKQVKVTIGGCGG